MTDEADNLHEETAGITDEVVEYFQVPLAKKKQAIVVHPAINYSCCILISQGAITVLGTVELADVQEMMDIKSPTADLIRIMKAVLLLLRKLKP